MVTQRTRELQYERDRTQAILETLGEAVVVTDMDGAVQYFNPAAVALTGFSEAEAVGQKWKLWQNSKSGDRGGAGPDEPLFEKILAVVRTGQTWYGEVNNKRKDGTCYDALLTVAPLVSLDDPEQTIGLVSVHSDITPQRG